MSDCCDDEDDACRDEDYWDYDDDLVPPKEEPDCYSCNDGGCPACEPHPSGCDCAACADRIVAEYEIFDDPGQHELVPAFVDEPPF